METLITRWPASSNPSKPADLTPDEHTYYKLLRHHTKGLPHERDFRSMLFHSLNELLFEIDDFDIANHGATSTARHFNIVNLARHTACPPPEALTTLIRDFLTTEEPLEDGSVASYRYKPWVIPIAIYIMRHANVMNRPRELALSLIAIASTFVILNVRPLQGGPYLADFLDITSDCIRELAAIRAAYDTYFPEGKDLPFTTTDCTTADLICAFIDVVHHERKAKDSHIPKPSTMILEPDPDLEDPNPS